MMTVSICVLASLLSVASPTTSYRHQSGARSSEAQSAQQGVAPVDRMTRQATINGRGQVWRSPDAQVGLQTTVARSSTTAHSFLVAGK
jgi:hypothetical protein